MDVSSMLEQVLHSGHSIEPCRKVQGRGVTALDVTAIDILWRAETLEEESIMK